jgi:carbamoyl-phosphate synthase large subunit
MAKTRILLLSGGNLVGQNVLDALANRRSSVELVATNSVADDLSLFAFDAVYLVPPTLRDPDAFESRLMEILERERPDLVVPCRDDDVLFLADFKGRRPRMADRLLCGNRFTAEVTCDKWLSWTFCRDHALPFAPSIPTPIGEPEAEEFAGEHGFPLLVKPRRGFASHGVYLVFNMAQLRRAVAREGQIVQKYLAGGAALDAYLREVDETGVALFHSFDDIKHSIQIFIAPDGSGAGNFCTRNIRRHGETRRLERYEGADAAALGAQCIDAFSRAGWRGPMNIQCQKTPEEHLVIYEFNGRLSGATAARYVMGHDEVGLAVSTFANHMLPARDGAGACTRVVRRAVDAASADSANVASLARDGFWRRKAG